MRGTLPFLTARLSERLRQSEHQQSRGRAPSIVLIARHMTEQISFCVHDLVTLTKPILRHVTLRSLPLPGSLRG